MKKKKSCTHCCHKNMITTNWQNNLSLQLELQVPTRVSHLETKLFTLFIFKIPQAMPKCMEFVNINFKS